VRTATVRSRLRGLILILCALMATIALSAVGTYRTVGSQINHLTTVIGPATSASAAVLQEMTDAQLGLVAYNATHEAKYLRLFVGAQPNVSSSLATVRDRLSIDPQISAQSRERMLALQTQQEEAVHAWWEFAGPAMAAIQRGGTTDMARGEQLYEVFRGNSLELNQQIEAERDASRQAARDIVGRNLLVLVAVSILALLAAVLVGKRTQHALTIPINQLRTVVRRQRAGDHDARAPEGEGVLEVRELAADFNALIEQNVSLSLAQAEALLMHELTRDLARLVRSAPSADAAIDVVCRALGGGLAVDRALFHIIDTDSVVRHGSQWARPGLTPLPDLSEELLRHEVEVAQEMWTAAAPVVLADFLVPEVQSRKRAQLFSGATGARAALMAPVGLGERVLGVIALMMVDGPRQWTQPEVNAVQQSAVYVARSIVQGEYDAHQAEHVDRLERLDRQKTDFMATISHELRTPLTSIAGYLELLRDGDVGDLTDTQDSMLGVIERNTVRLRGLIEDLLVLNRIEATGLRAVVRPVHVADLSDAVLEALRPVADAGGVSLVSDPVPAGAVVSADSAQVERALMNVVSNAIKFTPAAGSVRLRVSLVEDNDPPRVRIRVTDTGIGIPAEDVERLFVRFFRARNATAHAIPGTGLGLAIVKSIVEGHDGTLAVSSVEGEGTDVVIELPLADQPAADRVL
jgi:signal transduction histidine kinase